MDSVLNFLFLLSPTQPHALSFFPLLRLPMASRADLGDLAEGAAATPFTLKFCIIFIEFSEK